MTEPEEDGNGPTEDSDPTGPSWVWSSRVGSVEAGTPSIQAIAETVFAVLIVLLIGLLSGSWYYMILWTSMGWLLLLRTKQSMDLGASAFARWTKLKRERWQEEANRVANERSGTAPPFGMEWHPGVELPILVRVNLTLGIAVVSVLARLYGGIRGFLSGPLESLGAVFANYRRAALCLDLSTPVELVPGLYQRLDSISNPAAVDLRPQSLARSGECLPAALVLGSLCLGTFSAAILLPHAPVVAMVTILTCLGVFFLSIGESEFRALLLYPVAIWYRLSLKATCVAYLPLMYVSGPVRTSEPFEHQLLDVVKARWQKVVAAIAALTIMMFLGKVALFSLFTAFFPEVKSIGPWVAAFNNAADEVVRILSKSERLENHAGVISAWAAALKVFYHRVLDRIVQPYSFPPWHVAGVVNATLCLVGFFVYDNWLRAVREKKHNLTGWRPWVLRLHRSISRPLGIYTTAVFVFNLWWVVGWLEVPPIKGAVVPWLR